MAKKLWCQNCEEAWAQARRFYDNPLKRGLANRLRPTGQKAGSKREYVCLDCGYKGWTTSKALKE